MRELSLVLGRDIRLGKSRLIPFKYQAKEREREREREEGDVSDLSRLKVHAFLMRWFKQSKQQTRRSTDGRYPFSIIEFNSPRTALLMADRSRSIERMEKRVQRGVKGSNRVAPMAR